ncbi:MAG: extracellular solute-binding protein, partial [Stackebrandtia sp.]
FTSMGGYLFGADENGDPDPDDLGVDSEGGVAAFEKFHELGEAGDGVLRTSMTYDNAISFLEEGDTPFLISGPWAVRGAEAAGIDLEVSPIPGFEGEGPAVPFLGVQTFYVSSKAKNAVFAEEFVTNYVLDVDLATALYEADPRTPALIEAREAVSEDDPNLEGFQAAAEGASPMPSIPEMNAVWEPFGRALADVLEGAADGETAAEDAAEAIRKAIEDGA